MLADRVRKGNGVEVETPGGVLALDPARDAPVGVLSHAHTDHIPSRARKGDASPAPALMTRPTLDLLRVRRANRDGRAVAYGEPVDLGFAQVTLLDAGHVIGSAMARVEVEGERLLYTGDFSPVGGATSGRAQPESCDVLVVESTYGDPRFAPPPRDLVLANVEDWTLRSLLRGSAALGAHELGRAQELILLLNRAGITPVVTGDVARMTAIYNAHGHDLACVVLGSPKAEELAGNACYVVPHSYLRNDHAFVSRLRHENGSAAYLSGWCQVFSYFATHAIDAQFPLTDHATFPELIAFVDACAPKAVLAHHGRAESLARELGRRGVAARAL